MQFVKLRFVDLKLFQLTTTPCHHNMISLWLDCVIVVRMGWMDEAGGQAGGKITGGHSVIRGRHMDINL